MASGPWRRSAAIWRRELVGEEDVVVTQPGEVLARHRVDARVQRGRHAAVRPAKEPDPVAVPFRDGDRGTAIGRAVVDDDDLDVRPGLRERAVDGLGKEVGPVPDRDDDRDPGRRGLPAALGRDRASTEIRADDRPAAQRRDHAGDFHEMAAERHGDGCRGHLVPAHTLGLPTGDDPLGREQRLDDRRRAGSRHSRVGRARRSGDAGRAGGFG